MSDNLLTLAELAQQLGVSVSTARRLAKQAGFPPRYRLAERCVRWRSSEVERWLSGRAEAPVLVPAVVAEDLLVSRPRGPRKAAA